jgi:response regulator RpfG family c-di-GMP phosphodiesterase
MSVHGCEYGLPTVLVVDDDTLVRETVRMLLEDHGFRVVTATDGDDGLRKFRQIAPDVVLTDIIMPNKEGIAMIRGNCVVSAATRESLRCRAAAEWGFRITRPSRPSWGPTLPCTNPSTI